MSAIDAESQIRFLTNIQRLLDEGRFVASYKFALLLSLADLAVELGDDSARELEIPTRKIAEKFVLYYWRQALPYPKAGEKPTVLRQNTGKRAAIVSKIMKTQHDIGHSITHVRSDKVIWHRLLREVDRTVRLMPLWKLQTIGGEQADFLYESRGTGHSVRLRPGVGYCFRKFHGLISDLVRGAWLRYVRRTNQSTLGATTDLSDFLFGAERSQLGSVRAVLRDLQQGECFYCRKPVTSSAHVDHFIPWARYPVDLGHNFVLAHAGCNSAKGDRIASRRHLDRWIDRNLQDGTLVDELLRDRDVVCDLTTSWRITHWAYRSTDSSRIGTTSCWDSFVTSDRS
ncbi:MAG: HNH endonuclease [Acidobacteriota bacterium]